MVEAPRSPYQEIYSKRESVAGEDVIYVFGDILLKNAQDIVEQFPLPGNITFAPRLLDEYTRNSMLEKILARIDSKSFKMAEFISSDLSVLSLKELSRTLFSWPTVNIAIGVSSVI